MSAKKFKIKFPLSRTKTQTTTPPHLDLYPDDTIAMIKYKILQQFVPTPTTTADMYLYTLKKDVILPPTLSSNLFQKIKQFKQSYQITNADITTTTQSTTSTPAPTPSYNDLFVEYNHKTKFIPMGFYFPQMYPYIDPFFIANPTLINTTTTADINTAKSSIVASLNEEALLLDYGDDIQTIYVIFKHELKPEIRDIYFPSTIQQISPQQIKNQIDAQQQCVVSLPQYGTNATNNKTETWINGVSFILNTEQVFVLPLDVIFKRIHTDTHIPFIKLNPGRTQENLYRFYYEHYTNDGQPIPAIKKSVFNEYKTYKKIHNADSWTDIKKQRASSPDDEYILFSIFSSGGGGDGPAIAGPTGEPEIITVKIEKKGNIHIQCKFKSPKKTQQECELFFRSNVNPVLKHIRDILQENGYGMNLFGSFSDSRVADINITYQYSFLYNSLSDTDIKDLLRKMKSVFLIKKGVYFKKVNPIENTGFPILIQSDAINQKLTVVVSEIMNFSYLPVLDVYFGCFLIKKAEAQADAEADAEAEQIKQAKAEAEQEQADAKARAEVEEYKIKQAQEQADAKARAEAEEYKIKQAQEQADTKARAEAEEYKIKQAQYEAEQTEAKAQSEAEEKEEDDEFYNYDEEEDEDKVEHKEAEQLEQPEQPEQEEENDYDYDNIYYEGEEEEEEEEDEDKVEHKEAEELEQQQPEEDDDNIYYEGEEEEDEDIFKRGGADAGEEALKKQIDMNGIKNPIYERLQQIEPIFKQKTEYARKCLATEMRQAVVIPEKEMENIKDEINKMANTNKKKEAQEIYENALVFNKNTYVCPRYFCLLTNRPMTQSQVDAGECGGKIIGKNEGDLIPDKAKMKGNNNGRYIYEISDQKSHWAKGKYVKNIPLFKKMLANDKNNCLPCCFKKFNKNNPEDVKQQNYNQCMGVAEAEEAPTVAPKKTKKTDKNKDIDATTGTTTTLTNINITYKTPLSKNNWGFLPKILEKLFNINPSSFLIEKRDKNDKNEIKMNTPVLLRYGVDNIQPSFLSCMIDLLKIKNITTIADFKGYLKQNVSLDFFSILQNGALISLFSSNDAKEIENTAIGVGGDNNNNKYTQSYLYKTIMPTPTQTQTQQTPTPENLFYFKKIVNAYNNYMTYLTNSEAVAITHEFLWDLFSLKHPAFSKEGLNIFLFELIETSNATIGKTEEIRLLCPTNIYSSQPFHAEYPCMFLLKQENKIYEPLYMYTKKINNGEVEVVRKKTFLIEDNNNPVFIRSLLSQIKTVMENKCGSLSIVKDTTPYPVDVLWDNAEAKGWEIETNVLNYQNKTSGFTVVIKGTRRSL